MRDSQLLRYQLNPAKKGYKNYNYIRTKKSKVIISNDKEVIEFSSIEEVADKFKCSVQAVYQNFKRKTLLVHKYRVNIIKP